MKINKNFEPILSGLSAAIVIGVLSFITLNTNAGVWLLLSFGASTFLVFVLYDSEPAQPKNIFFGHLISILVGILFNELFGISFLTLGVSVGIAVSLMVYFKVMHPPAASNPLVALFSDMSYETIIFPVVVGTLTIIIFAIFLNRIVLKRKYPKRKIF